LVAVIATEVFRALGVVSPWREITLNALDNASACCWWLPPNMLEPSPPNSESSPYSDILLTFGIGGSPSSGLWLPEGLPREIGVMEALVELVPSFVPMLLAPVDFAGDVAGELFAGLVGVRFSVLAVVVEDWAHMSSLRVRLVVFLAGRR
jgi:hypothetical protein